MKGETWKIILTLVLIVAAAWYFWPTVQFFTMDDAQKAALKQADPDEFVQLQKRAIKLGLDLQGGMHVVLEVDKSQLDENAAKDAVDRALEIIRNRIDEFGVSEPLIQKQGNDRIVVELPALQDPERARNLIGQTALLEFKLVESPENTQALFKKLDKIAEKLSPTSTTPKSKEPGATDAFENPFGDSSKSAANKADSTKDTTAAVADEEGANALTQYLEFTGTNYAVQDQDYEKVKAILEHPDVKAAIPAEDQIAWSRGTELVSGRKLRELYLLKSKVELSGRHLTDARPNYDQYHKPRVDFTFDREGGNIFGRVTGPNIGKPLAILLDGKVESAPNIKSKIRDQGVIDLTGQQTYYDAKDLATVLRAGALPAPVKIVENNVVGPTLGKDSIDAGKTGIVVGLILIIAFMFLYYRMSGLLADGVLVLNIFFLLAIMASLNATLTLPGIAGIILTMGVTVDASVLIFERIRDELRTGKTVRAAIEAGYDRATVTIIDSNLTTLIAAGVLYYFGTGPIKGFAVTLGAGIIISLYTSLIVGKTIFSYRRKATSLSI
ncbi:MAG: protein translocase subunit SecD [candidate division Zixibacteria bacterium]|nr:protein translocase subunit SecD [candidate division Zixibacteria bacterium]